MRFFADGPSIPERLLEDRDNGNVVFFCGAGVSRPAGLPGFVDLAEQVVEELGAPPEAKVRTMLARAKHEPDGAVSLDQIFSILQHEYRSTNIDEIVSKLLRTPSSAKVDRHQLILRLSRNASHQAQLVTTNFDLLFERAQNGIQTHVAPALPDISSGQRLTGLVYLHGRLNHRSRGSAEHRQLILSSSDFGRAYLADAWATRFVRDLLNNYTIVLLGYSANDPPVRYLLEGLHSRSSFKSAQIYAFDQGTQAEVQDRWRDRGVIPLAYPRSPEHSTLWDSLNAWADRADDPERWRRSILALATNNPKNLTAHERGQVVSLARTTAGAKLFADALDTPPAEWICVFDKHVRYGEPLERGKEETIDPLAFYGIDDDPPRPKPDDGELQPITDVLSPSPMDEEKNEFNRLAGVHERAADPLSPRLFYISRWFGKTLDQPASLWWAAGYIYLHPRLEEQIDWYLNHSGLEFDPKARRLWEILLEKFERTPKEQNSPYRVVDKIKRRGWSAQIHYELEDAVQPFLRSRRPIHAAPIPPEGAHEATRTKDIVRFEVEFPARGANDLEPPPEELNRLFRSARRGLERGAALLGALETRFWRTASFQSDDRPGERHFRDSDLYLFWAKNLFDQLCSQNPFFARNEVLRWPRNEIFFFNKLTIYAWTKTMLFSGKEVGEGLTDLHEEGFWDTYHRRELLHLLRGRWADIPPEIRVQIEERIIAGQTISETEDREKAERRNAGAAASILGWMRRNGCTLSEDTARRLPLIQAKDPDWDDRWESSADHSLEGRSGYVTVNADPSKIVNTPISEIIEAAEKHSTRPFSEFTEHRPFSGLVKQRPQRALAALAYQARRDNYPLRFWEITLGDWPDNASDRLQCLFAARLARLPYRVISELPHYVPQWLSKNLPALAKLDRERAFAVWDAILAGLTSNGSKALQSSIGASLIGGKLQHSSRRTYEHAINSPIGTLSATLFKLLGDQELAAGSGIPSGIRERLERVLGAPGEGADHATCEITIRLNWLFYLDPEWVSQRLIPMFSANNPQAEPAWNGFLHSENLGPPELFGLLKTHFLEVFEYFSMWRWSDQAIDRLHEFLVVACYWHKKSRRYVSFAEARLALQRSSDDGRSHAVSSLGSIIASEDAWRSFGKPFILKAWPREARCQTSSSSRQFAAIAEASGDNFPDVVRTVSHYLMPSNQLDLFIYKMKERRGDKHDAAKLPRRFPNAMLTLLDRLVPDDPNLAPHELGSLVSTLAGADAGLRQDVRWRRLSKLVHSR